MRISSNGREGFREDYAAGDKGTRGMTLTGVMAASSIRLAAARLSGAGRGGAWNFAGRQDMPAGFKVRDLLFGLD